MVEECFTFTFGSDCGCTDLLTPKQFSMRHLWKIKRVPGITISIPY